MLDFCSVPIQELKQNKASFNLLYPLCNCIFFTCMFVLFSIFKHGDLQTITQCWSWKDPAGLVPLPQVTAEL